MNGWGVFSTLRVCEGVLFEYARHYARMKHDAQRMRVPFPFSQNALAAELDKLIQANQAFDATLRVVIVRNRGGAYEGTQIAEDCDLIAFTTGLTQWGSGVRLTYVPNARLGSSPHAGAKVTSWIENLVWNESVRAMGFDEAILLNEKGQVSECTSANIFAVVGAGSHSAIRVITPPLDTAGCLPGITRALLLEKIQLPSIQIEEAELTCSQLEIAEASFITSSTRDVLPILEVDAKPLRQSPDLIAMLQNAFTQYRSDYIATHARSRAVLTL